MSEGFTSKFPSVLDVHAPHMFYAASEQMRYRRGKKTLIDRKIISMIRRKDQLRHMACRSSLNASVHAEHKRIREEFCKKLRRRRRDFVKGKMDSAGNDQRKLWKALTEITGYKELDWEDTTEISAQSFAGMLKAHMSSPHSPMKSAHPSPEATTGPSFVIKQVSVEAVKIALQNINTNKATGIDLIPPRALQHAASVVGTPLLIIINTSIQLQCFPLLWGRARVFRVYTNKGSKCDSAMYRPISILCTARWCTNGWWARNYATFLRTPPL